MSTDIYTGSTGRAISSYDLLDEMQDAYNLNRREAHESITAFLAQIIDADGERAVVEARRPVRPELVGNNPADVDIDYWTTITDTAADDIRRTFATVFPTAEVEA